MASRTGALDDIGETVPTLLALPGVDVHRTGHGQDAGLQTHTDIMPHDFLKQGDNRI